MDFCEFKATLIYIVSSRTFRTTYHDSKKNSKELHTLTEMDYLLFCKRAPILCSLKNNYFIKNLSNWSQSEMCFNFKSLDYKKIK